MTEINSKLYSEVNRVFKRLSLLRRWTTDLQSSAYSELAKQAFNCLITFFIACEVESAGVKLDWTKFPKIALYRAFQKAYISYDVSEETLDEICEMSKLPLISEGVTTEIICEKTTAEFAQELSEAYTGTEHEIFSAARTIGTYVEMKENEECFNGDFMNMIGEINRKLVKFNNIPGIEKWYNTQTPQFKLLQKISKLRNQVRWIAYAHQKDCSVLGHLFDTGIFAYLMSAEENSDEEVATQMFFMGIFHDIPEVWTKDIPSPIKDKIPGFREATEAYELKKIDENIYAICQPMMVEKLKTVMMEDNSNAFAKPLLKGADYLSASRECYLQIVAGTRDGAFYRAAHDLDVKIGEKKARLTPEAKAFYYKDLLKKVEERKGLFIFE